MLLRLLLPVVVLALPGALAAQDRFTAIIEKAPESTVNSGGFVVNHRREAVQRELAMRPPTEEELGVKLPPGAVLNLEKTARQIAQFKRAWRIYDYKVTMTRSEFIRFFTAQGLAYNTSRQVLQFTAPGSDNPEFIDSAVEQETVSGFRIWRKPR